MLSFPDIAILSGLALIVFGPERLPQIARQAGQAIGTLKSTANSFVQEMERPTIIKPVDQHPHPVIPESEIKS